MKGQLHKMRVSQDTPVKYYLELENTVCMNDYIGKSITLSWSGVIQCVSCQKVTKSSFGQGFCYTCFTQSAQAAECIIRPELCRAHLGEGRDIAWEEANHNQPHVVYLAQSDIVKVGVTRETQIPTRWIDQGAVAAIKVAETPNRYLAGVLEVALKDHFSDKTNWQRMLRNEVDESIDLVEEKWQLEGILPDDLLQYFTEDDEILAFEYPVNQYPTKVKSMALEKLGSVSGILQGIKGQYLLFDGDRVINLRKYSGYMVEFRNDEL
jgi:hypothetical protein